MKTRFQLHVERWQSCDLCELSQTRSRVVLARGKVPCDLLFVGEAPGHSEDSLGKPFVGPAGKLLDRIIDKAVPQGSLCPECSTPVKDSSWGTVCENGHGGIIEREDLVGHWRMCFTNLVCCLPLDEDGDKTSEPPDSGVQACQPRLKEFVELCQPKGIVTVGSLARDWLDPKYKSGLKLEEKVPQCFISHPAAILRANVAQQGLMVQRAVVVLQNFIEELRGI